LLLNSTMFKTVPKLGKYTNSFAVNPYVSK